MSGPFEFDDVIRQAKAIVRPEETVNEMKKLEKENAQLRAELDRINRFDIEDYIRSLHWTPDAKDYEITLVAGNLRSLYHRLTKGIHETDDSDQAQYRHD